MSKEPMFGPGDRPHHEITRADATITNVQKGVARPLLITPDTASPADERETRFDPNKIGFTMDISEETVWEIERMRLDYERALRNPKPFLFR